LPNAQQQRDRKLNFRKPRFADAIVNKPSKPRFAANQTLRAINTMLDAKAV
jgi:hypothetical protein